MTSKSEVIKLIEQYIENTNTRDNKPELTSSSWYLPNRAGYIKDIHKIFGKYELKKQEEGNTDLDKSENLKLELFPHQKFVKDYLQVNSPYKGLLLYHGLGVGKTCASIATAELLGSDPKMKICVMLPASLEMNYINEILKCGHPYYSLEQNWSFIRNQDLKKLDIRSKVFDIMDKKIYDKNGGFWFSTPNKKSNYSKYDEKQKEQINRQLNNIISLKYNILHYNGINTKSLNNLTKEDTINPFEDTIVIIDEVHNFISRVINGSKISEKIYELLYYAKNCKILCLSGTPLINKPLELAFLINLIKRPTIEYKLKTNENLEDKKIRKLEYLLENHKLIDNFVYDALQKKILINFIPNGFSINANKKIINDSDNINDETNLKIIKKLLNESDFKFNIDKEAIEYKVLPTNEKKFTNLFIDVDNNKIKNEDLLMRRILGSVSYFVYTKSELFPEIRKNELVEVELSDIQFKKYIEARNHEIRKERRFKKDEDAAQIYKAFTRQLANFTFPEEIERPYPSKLKLMLSDMDVVDDYHQKIKNKLIKLDDKDNKDKKDNKDEIPVLTGPKNYNEDDYSKKIEEILQLIEDDKDIYLKKDLKLYSPKFYEIVKSLEKSEGSALIYSQFRNVEGIGLLKKTLSANGYAEFKLKKQKNTYVLDIDKEDYNKPKYAEFTGDKEMTNVLLDIFNNNLKNLSKDILKDLDKLHSKEKEVNNGNLRGSLIKIMMITQSGSEGISLKNVRQVHVVEPYWNMIRIDQVIGRAARTGSHLGLPKSERNIDVFRYISVFSKEQLKDTKVQRMDRGMTSDQVINSIAERKQFIMNNLLNLMKSSAVDCHLHKKNHSDVECFSYPINIQETEITFKPNIEKEELDYMKEQKEEQVKLDLNRVEIKGIEYMILIDDKENNTGQLFDKDEYDKFKTIKFVGLLLKKDDNYILRLKDDTKMEGEKEKKGNLRKEGSKVIPDLEDKLLGSGNIQGETENITKMLNQVTNKNQVYEHKIIEHGGNPNCSYCTMSAIINEVNRLKGVNKRYTYVDMREMVIKEVSKLGEDEIRALYTQEFGNKDTEENRKEFNDKSEKMSKKEIMEELIEQIRTLKWGTEYDLSVFINKFDIGLLIIDRDGKVYNIAQNINNKKYYALVYYTGNHYQTLALRKEDEPYRYVYKCDELPKPIIKIINNEAKKSKDIKKFQC